MGENEPTLDNFWAKLSFEKVFLSLSFENALAGHGGSQRGQHEFEFASGDQYGGGRPRCSGQSGHGHCNQPMHSPSPTLPKRFENFPENLRITPAAD